MLEVRDLTKVYRPKKGRPVTALDRVSIKFEETGMVFVLGKSGSGKSTFLHLLGGLDNITGGEVIIKGKSSADFKQSDFDSYRNTYLGFIFQEYNIMNDFTVGQNIGLALELQGKKADHDSINAILKEVDLEGYANRKPHELSGGQKQRVAIARALIKDPEVIMADEPTGALDSNTGKQVFETLQKLSKNKLVIVVSHDREYAEYYGDRVIEFKDGKVISDIKKYTAGGKVLAGGAITIVDDTIMQIKKDYKLNNQDRQEVLKFLDNAPSDLIISKDVRSNIDFQKSARIDSEGNREAFADTTEKNMTIKQYGANDFRLKRSRLPSRHALRIGASGLKVKPFRLFLTILLSFVAFGLFGLADTMAAYDKTNAMYNSLNESNISTVAISKKAEVVSEWDNNSKWMENVNMSEADISKLKAKYPTIHFSPLKQLDYNMSSFYNINFGSLYQTTSTSNLSGAYHVSNFNGYAENTVQSIEQLGFTIDGKYPTEGNEIAISEHAAETFINAKYQYNESSIAVTLTKASDLKNKILVLGNTEYKITAIIDTNFDSERYKKLKDSNLSWTIGLSLLSQEKYTLNQYGYHSALFTAPGFGDTFFQYTQNMHQDRKGGIAPVDYQVERGGQRQYISAVAKFSDVHKARVTFFNGATTTLAQGKAIISSDMVQGLYQDHAGGLHDAIIDYLNEGDYYDDEIKPLFVDIIKSKALNEQYYFYNEEIENWEWRYFNEVEAQTIAEAMATVENYLNYIRGITVDHYYENDENYHHFQIYDWETWRGNPVDPDLETYPQLNEKQEVIVRALSGLGHEMDVHYGASSPWKVEIVGIYDIPKNNYGDNSFYNAMLFNPADFEDLFPQSSTIVSVMATLPDNKQTVVSFINFSYSTNDGVQYKMENEISVMLDQVNSLIEVLGKVFLYVGIGFAVFAALMLFNFISVSISYKRKEIGILRAVGARSSDVFRIFFYESLIIAGICVVLALIGTFAAYMVINAQIRGMGVLISILDFGIRQVALVCAVGILTAFVSTFLPVHLIARKKPIEAIKK